MLMGFHAAKAIFSRNKKTRYDKCYLNPTNTHQPDCHRLSLTACKVYKFLVVWLIVINVSFISVPA